MMSSLRKVLAPDSPEQLLAWPPRSGQRIAKDVNGRNLRGRLDSEARHGVMREERVEFEQFVANLVTGFAAVEAKALGSAIDECLSRIGERLRLDQASVWRKTPDAQHFTPLFSWVRSPNPSSGPDIPVACIPWVTSRLAAGNAASFSRINDIPDASDRDWFERSGTRSMAILPLDSGETAVALGSTTCEREMTPPILERLRLLASLVSQALARRDADEALRAALEEVRTLRQRLESARAVPQREVRPIRSSRTIVSASSAIRRALAQVTQVAPTPATVLLLGETGSGKEVFAQAIHDLSPRHQRPMVKVSCAAIPSALIESELFGRERGAYTGALSRQIGRFEAAHQSTLFLDEIGDLPAEMQVKLLRVLQERVIERLGSTQSIKVDVRIIAATNRNLEKAVEDRTFREDLFYRLNVFPIVVPPLRERVEDIPELVWAFTDELSKSFGKSIASISPDSIRELQRYSWPGNVRELRNHIERAVILATGPQLELSTPAPVPRIPQGGLTLVDLEVEHIRTVLESTNWRVRGAGGAAERLGLKPTTLESRMARFGLKRQAPAQRARQTDGVSLPSSPGA